MAVKVIITRRFKEGYIREAAKLLIEARNNAMHEEGYISSETLNNCDNPDEIVVLSMWESRQDWWRYKESAARQELEHRFDEMMETKTQTVTYDLGLKY